ncbi:unnamed protein product [Durusdinium trenchii]|uniref:TOG domain-containing protein n=1 Tax=Durusdinium trenchii TaxID=1381693 RepID=A0ABP0QMS2_9DINO
MPLLVLFSRWLCLSNFRKSGRFQEVRVLCPEGYVFQKVLRGFGCRSVPSKSARCCKTAWGGLQNRHICLNKQIPDLELISDGMLARQTLKSSARLHKTHLSVCTSRGTVFLFALKFTLREDCMSYSCSHFQSQSSIHYFAKFEQRQSLLAESLRLASESLHICGSGAELRRQVLQEIFSVAIDALSDQAYQIRDAAKQFFRAAEHALGTEQLQEEILDVAPSRLKLAMEALEHPGPQLAHASCAGGPRNGGQRKLRRPIRAAAILPARSTSTSVRDLEALQSDGAGGPCDSERRKAGEARYADIETLEAQILDYCDDLARSPTGKVDWPQRARDLQSSLQDIAMRYAQQSLVSLLLPLLTWVLRLCRAAEAASEEAVGLLKAAHEVMRTLRAFSTEVLRCIDPLPLFRSALQNLICLQVLSQKSDVIRRCTTPILLEVPPFLARLMDTVEAGKQLLAWLQLASELLLDKALKTTHSSLQARKSWALKFCARAVERCSANLQACDEVWAWEVLSEIARCWECLETGSDEWKQMLQALCSKIIQHHWSEAKEFAALAGTHGQLPAPLKELLVHRITA